MQGEWNVWMAREGIFGRLQRFIIFVMDAEGIPRGQCIQGVPETDGAVLSVKT